MLAEDLGIMKKGSFSSMDNSNIYDAEIDKMTQQGYGKKKGRSGKWQTHVAATRSKNKDKSYKQCLQIASKSYKK